jgi:bacterioferritin (cytochrome b1)
MNMLAMDIVTTQSQEMLEEQLLDEMRHAKWLKQQLII